MISFDIDGMDVHYRPSLVELDFSLLSSDEEEQEDEVNLETLSRTSSPPASYCLSDDIKHHRHQLNNHKHARRNSTNGMKQRPNKLGKRKLRRIENDFYAGLLLTGTTKSDTSRIAFTKTTPILFTIANNCGLVLLENSTFDDNDNTNENQRNDCCSTLNCRDDVFSKLRKHEPFLFGEFWEGAIDSNAAGCKRVMNKPVSVSIRFGNGGR